METKCAYGMALLPLLAFGAPTALAAGDRGEDIRLLPPDGREEQRFGHALAGGGDVDGDGYDDLLVAAPETELHGGGEGVVWFYRGSLEGLLEDEVVALEDPCSTGSAFGSALDFAGDVDSDGYDDVVVGGPDCDGAGAAWLIPGSAAGMDWGRASELSAPTSYGGAGYGAVVGGAGDLDGDGYPDVLVGYESNSELVIFHGSAAGIDASNPTTLRHSGTGWSSGWGSSAAGVGDVDGDGYDDLLVGTDSDPMWSEAEVAYLYLGSPVGPDPASEIAFSENTIATYYGSSVAGAGDVNGDGLGDLLVGAPYPGSGQWPDGAALLYLGGSAEPQVLESAQSHDWQLFGYALDGGGDANGDGWPDAVVATTADSGTDGAGHLFFGDGAQLDPASEQRLEASDADGSAFVLPSAAFGGDLNGDGADEVVLGDWYREHEAGQGAVYLWFGHCASTSVWYPDSDGDGFGDPAQEREACAQPSGWVAASSDCDDGDASVYPGAPEIPDDGVDQDCDGQDEITPDDTAPPEDSQAPPEDSPVDPEDSAVPPMDSGEPKDDGKGCAVAGAGLATLWLPALLGLALVRRYYR
jgi:hypothetical protein